jgi:hypothetical protein
LLTAWDPQDPDPALREPNPNLLPEGFLIDRQRNKRCPNTLTYYLNHELMSQRSNLGIRVLPRPEPAPKAKAKDDFFVHYLQAAFGADAKTIAGLLKPNATLLLDIVMLRVVRKGIFRLTTKTSEVDFTKDGPDEAIL